MVRYFCKHVTGNNVASYSDTFEFLILKIDFRDPNSDRPPSFDQEPIATQYYMLVTGWVTGFGLRVGLFMFQMTTLKDTFYFEFLPNVPKCSVSQVSWYRGFYNQKVMGLCCCSLSYLAI